jgi:hypothetical protein
MLTYMLQQVLRILYLEGGKYHTSLRTSTPHTFAPYTFIMQNALAGHMLQQAFSTAVLHSIPHIQAFGTAVLHSVPHIHMSLLCLTSYFQITYLISH